MRVEVDTDTAEVVVYEGGERHRHALGSQEAFAAISQVWLRSGWDTKHVYTFSWLGRPIIQLPEDMVRLQEVIHRVQPDLLIETGVAHGGSLVFYASLFEAMGRGRVIGVDIEIRAHNRDAIEAHPLFPRITLIEGDSVDPATVATVTSHVKPGETVMVCLDSAHSKLHVLAELRAYAPLVSIGSYVVAMDGIMAQVAGAPRTEMDWAWNNPAEAVKEFVAESEGAFVLAQPAFEFNESALDAPVTYWPDGFVKRVAE